MLDNPFQDSVRLLIFVNPLVVLVVRLLFHQPIIKLDVLLHDLLLLLQPQVGLALSSHIQLLADLLEIRNVLDLGHVLLSQPFQSLNVKPDELR